MSVKISALQLVRLGKDGARGAAVPKQGPEQSFSQQLPGMA